MCPKLISAVEKSKAGKGNRERGEEAVVYFYKVDRKGLTEKVISE